MRAVPETEPVSYAGMFGNTAARYRIGLIELATAEAAEPDFHAMLPPGAMFFTSRVLNENPVNLDNLREHRSRLALAAEQLLPGAGLDVICYSCTSGTVASGFDAIEAEIQRARPGVPVVTPITAALAAFEHLGLRRISMLTPYTADVNDAMAAYLQERGIEIVNVAGFLIESDLDMARLSPVAIRQAAIEVLEEIEQALGKPVISSIQAAFWQCIRIAGHELPIDGYGTLLRQVTGTEE
jgi:maleate isomerase